MARRAGLELLAVVVAGLGQHIGQRGAALLLRGGLFALGGRAVFLGHRQADLLCEVFHRVDKGHAAVFGQEADGVAVRAAAEAVIELFARADREARRLLGMEGAQAAQVRTTLAKLHVPAHHFGNVDTGQQVVDKGRRDHGNESNEVAAPHFPACQRSC